MKQATAAAFTFLLMIAWPEAFAESRFEKVTDHYYWLECRSDGPIVSAVITEGGVVLINPPGEPDLADVMSSLKKLTGKPVKWVLNTDYTFARDGGGDALARQGAALIGSAEFWRLADSVVRIDNPSAPAGKKEEGSGKTVPVMPARLIFGKQMRLYPDNVEIRVQAVQSKAQTGGDILVFIPAEKVLIVGELFSPGSYPVIDIGPGEGSALGWLEGMKQVIDSVPLLKSAMPPPKPDPSKPPPEEKTLEELMVVVPGHGPRSNLREMKSLLEMSQRLKADAARAVSTGRTREHFLSSVALGPYRQYGNLEPFATELYDELAAQRRKPEK